MYFDRNMSKSYSGVFPMIYPFLSKYAFKMYILLLGVWEKLTAASTWFNEYLHAVKLKPVKNLKFSCERQHAKKRKTSFIILDGFYLLY